MYSDGEKNHVLLFFSIVDDLVFCDIIVNMFYTVFSGRRDHRVNSKSTAYCFNLL